MSFRRQYLSIHGCVADGEQCKYGKNRVEADAKRLQNKEEELMKRKQEIRNHLTQLKKERKDLRTALEAATGKSLVRLIKVKRKCMLKSTILSASVRQTLTWLTVRAAEEGGGGL